MMLFCSLMACVPLALAAPEGHGTIIKMDPNLRTEGQLAEPSCEQLLDESPPEQAIMERIVYDSIYGGASHIKVGSGNAKWWQKPEALLYDLKAAAAVSREVSQSKQQATGAMANELQDALTTREPGACLDKNTPEDGHCLFHACVSGFT